MPDEQERPSNAEASVMSDLAIMIHAYQDDDDALARGKLVKLHRWFHEEHYGRVTVSKLHLLAPEYQRWVFDAALAHMAELLEHEF